MLSGVDNVNVLCDGEMPPNFYDTFGCVLSISKVGGAVCLNEDGLIGFVVPNISVGVAI